MVENCLALMYKRNIIPLPVGVGVRKTLRLILIHTYEFDAPNNKWFQLI